MNGEVFCFDAVAPVRERGLKLLSFQRTDNARPSRSRKGAWIEISADALTAAARERRSRKGAWIEIIKLSFISVLAPSLP